MSIAESILPEYDHEITTLRTLLAVVPEQNAEWRPHPKSMALGALAAHLSNLCAWVPITLTQTELDLNPPGGSGDTPPGFTTTVKLLADFDRGAAAARAAIAATSDADFQVPWTLKSGEHVIFTEPRFRVLRLWTINHQIHHRGQLSVYLRLRGVPLPSIYGPTADMA